MKNLREFFLLASVAATAAAGLALVGCGGDDNDSSTTGDGDAGAGAAPANAPRFAYVTNGVDPFWTLAEAGVKQAVIDHGVACDVLMPAAGAVEQKSMLEDLVTRGVDGIAVSPIDAGNQIDLLNMVAERTILITHDSDAPESNRKVFIGVDNYDAGRACGQLVKEALPDGGTIMILIGRMEQDNSKRRRQGVIDELLDRDHNPERFDEPGNEIKNEKFTILGTLTDQFDRAKAKANAEDALSRYPDLSAFVGLFAYNPPLALEALDQAGKLGKVKVIAFDEADATLQGILDGTVHGTVVQNPYMYGYRSVEVLKSLHEGQTNLPENKFINVPARQIRKADVDEFWTDLKIKLGKE